MRLRVPEIDTLERSPLKVILQAFEAMYRWHQNYTLGSNPLSQLSSGVVLDKIRQFARDFGLHNNTLFGCEVLKAKFDNEKDRYGHHLFNSPKFLSCIFLCTSTIFL